MSTLEREWSVDHAEEVEQPETGDVFPIMRTHTISNDVRAEIGDIFLIGHQKVEKPEKGEKFSVARQKKPEQQSEQRGETFLLKKQKKVEAKKGETFRTMKQSKDKLKPSTEDIQKQLKYIESWLRADRFEWSTIQSKEDLKRLFLEEHPEDRKTLEKISAQSDRLFEKFFLEGSKREKKKVEEVEKHVKKWSNTFFFDPEQTASSDALKAAFLKQYPTNKNIVIAYTKQFEPIFTTAYKQLVHQHEKKRKTALSDISRFLEKQLLPADILDGKLQQFAIFETLLLRRLDGKLRTYEKSLQRGLQLHARKLVKTLHEIWKQKHLTQHDAKRKGEYAALEKVVGSWKPKIDAKTTFAVFERSFFAMMSQKHLPPAHRAFLQPLLKMRWEKLQYEGENTEKEKEEEQDSLATVEKNGAVTPQESALEYPHRLYGKVNWEAFESNLNDLGYKNRMHIGDRRLKELMKTHKMNQLFSGSYQDLLPFLLATLSVVEDEGQIKKCVDEMRLSSSFADSMKIMLSNSTLRKAAYKVKRNASIWDRFQKGLESAGISTSELKMDKNQDDRDASEVDAELLQEVIIPDHEEESKDELTEVASESTYEQNPEEITLQTRMKLERSTVIADAMLAA